MTGLTLTLLHAPGKHVPRRLSSRGTLRRGRSPQPRAAAQQLRRRALAPGTAQPQLLLIGPRQQMLAPGTWTGAWLLHHRVIPLGPGGRSHSSEHPWDRVSLLLPTLLLWVNEARSRAGVAFTHSHTCVSPRSRMILQNNDRGLLGRSEIPPGLFCHLEETMALRLTPCLVPLQHREPASTLLPPQRQTGALPAR